jgi:beta-fructofuranosidase
MAVSQDRDLRAWKKVSDPVIAAPPAGLDVTGFRDPYVWREGDCWMLILGSGFRHKGGAILLYRSPDLRHWTYLHPLIEGASSNQKAVNPVDTGGMWECPDFFPLANKHVLLISTMGKVFWKVGAYHDQRFFPEKGGVIDWGSYYAAKTMLDKDGNRILWGWIPETRPEGEHRAAGWAGVMALPRILSLNPDGELQMEFLPATRKLRHGKSDNIRDLAAELECDAHLAPDSSFALRVQSENGQTFASIRCSNREFQVNDKVAPLPQISALELHAFLDGSVMEVLINKTTALTARVYQVPSGPLRVVREGNAEIKNFQLWQVQPISDDRLTSPLCD